MKDLESEEKIAIDIAKLERNLKPLRKKTQEPLLVALNIATVYSMH